jgi:hypothetical protein
MGVLRNTLPEYLHLLENFVPGILFTLAIEKKLDSLFGPAETSTKQFVAETLAQLGFGERIANDAEKLVRIVHTTAFLVGLLARDGQKIFWMTDNDNICSNNELMLKVLDLFAQVLNLYVGPGCKFPVLGGATPFAPRDLHTLDLLSAADVVAGSLEQFLSRRDADFPEVPMVKPGADVVLQWLGHQGIALKKMNMVMRLRDGIIETTTLEFVPKEIPDGVTIIPVAV